MGGSSRASGSLPFLLLLLLTHTGERATVTGQVVFPTTEPCTLKTGEAGSCVPLTDCPSVLQTFKQQPPVSCGFRGFTQIVCCPKNEGDSNGNPEEFVDISPPSGYDTLDCGRSAIKTFETFGSPFGSELPLPSRQKRENVPLSADSSLIGINRPAVVGGIIVERAAWPWAALVGQNDTLGTNWFCGGVLINEYWVLSAIHCFDEFRADVVRLGEHNYADDNDGASHEDYIVTNLISYPDYKPPEAYHDLALLKLATKVKLQTFILPVCLPWGRKSEENIINSITTIVGWGNLLHGGLPSTFLREADVQVFPSSRCDRSYSKLRNYQRKWPQGIGEETLCAGDPEGGKDACQGDSGGPLVSRDGRGRYVLAGIVSRGFGCGHKDFPGLYANVRHQPYLAWIKKVAFSPQ